MINLYVRTGKFRNRLDIPRLPLSVVRMHSCLDVLANSGLEQVFPPEMAIISAWRSSIVVGKCFYDHRIGSGRRLSVINRHVQTEKLRR